MICGGNWAWARDWAGQNSQEGRTGWTSSWVMRDLHEGGNEEGGSHTRAHLAPVHPAALGEGNWARQRTGILLLGLCQLWVPFNLGWLGSLAALCFVRVPGESGGGRSGVWPGNCCPAVLGYGACGQLFCSVLGRFTNTSLFAQDYAGAAQCGAGGGPHCCEENVPLCQANWLCSGLDGGRGWTSCLQVRCGQNCMFVEIFLLHQVCSLGDV